MSIARMAVRIAATQALLNRTMVEDRVRDSSIVDLESALVDAPKPIALVYTDDSEYAPTGKSIFGGQGSTTMVIIVAVAGATVMDGETQFSFPATDKAIELSLDIIERQIQVALTNPDSPWAAIFMGLVTKVAKWQSRRGGSTKEGVRFGARQIIMELETVNDPIPGGPVEGEWVKFLDLLMEGTADLAGLADPLRALMEGTTQPDWKRTMAELGITRPVLAGIGLEPLRFHSDIPGAPNGGNPAGLEILTVQPGNISSDDEAVNDGTT